MKKLSWLTIVGGIFTLGGFVVDSLKEKKTEEKNKKIIEESVKRYLDKRGDL